MSAPLDLNAIRARLAAATPGPWECSAHAPSPRSGDWQVFDDEHGIYPPLGHSGPVAMCPGAALAAFIAHAREDVPALLAEVERLRGVLAEAAALVGMDADGADLLPTVLGLLVAKGFGGDAAVLDRANRLAAENERLTAENAALRAPCESAGFDVRGMLAVGEELVRLRDRLAAYAMDAEPAARRTRAIKRAGADLANCAYNVAQAPALDRSARRSLHECRLAWDAAIQPDGPK